MILNNIVLNNTLSNALQFVVSHFIVMKIGKQPKDFLELSIIISLIFRQLLELLRGG